MTDDDHGSFVMTDLTHSIILMTSATCAAPPRFVLSLGRGRSRGRRASDTPRRSALRQKRQSSEVPYNMSFNSQSFGSAESLLPRT